MPRGVPRALLEHLWLRVEEREISVLQLELFATWLEAGPEVAPGRWFKRFPEMTVCGEGELIRRFCGSARSQKARKSSDPVRAIRSFSTAEAESPPSVVAEPSSLFPRPRSRLPPGSCWSVDGSVREAIAADRASIRIRVPISAGSRSSSGALPGSSSTPAFDYLVKNTPNAEGDCVEAINRYIVKSFP